MKNTVQTLRDAVECLRAAVGTSPTPWKSGECHGEHVVRDGSDGMLVAITGSVGSDNEGLISAADARWIAMMSPDLAEPLAQMMMNVADGIARGYALDRHYDPLFEVAQLIIEGARSE